MSTSFTQPSPECGLGNYNLDVKSFKSHYCRYPKHLLKSTGIDGLLANNAQIEYLNQNTAKNAGNFDIPVIQVDTDMLGNPNYARAAL